MTWHPEIPLEYRNRIVTGDARELAKRIPDESVDLYVLDPPYGINYASSCKTRRNGEPRLNMPDFGKDEFDASWMPDVARTLKTGGALYLFTRWDVLPRWKAAIEAAGLQVRQRIIWDKAHWKMGDLRYYGSQTEDILFCTKGEHLMSWPKREGNVWRESAAFLIEGQYDHPTQKPESIISRMIVNSSQPGDVVADLFCGSGTTPTCAKKLARNWLACDIRGDYVAMARQRVALTQPPLPIEMPEQLSILEVTE